MWPFSSRKPHTAKDTNRRRNSFRPRLEALEDRNLLSTFSVVNTSDSGAGSLRQAIMQVNEDTQPAADMIVFAIGTGQQTIVPLSALPAITHAVIIDGTTQPGYAGTPLIELDGASAGSTANGLILSAAGSTVQGLVINCFGNDGVLVAGNDDVVAGCYLGTDVTGTVSLANLRGVEVTGSANTIGGTTAGARNLISGDHVNVEASVGALLEGNGNLVEGDFIGTDLTGAHVLAKFKTGAGYSNAVGVKDMGTANTIGSTAPGAGNVISSNLYGIELWGSTGSLVEGNLIGTDVTGTHPIPNDIGVWIVRGHNPAPVGGNNIIGGTAANARNIISGNLGQGIYMNTEGDACNVIDGNYIGTDITGTLALGNAGRGSGNRLQLVTR